MPCYTMPMPPREPDDIVDASAGALTRDVTSRGTPAPVRALMMRLGSDDSRRTVYGCLKRVCAALGSPARPEDFPWHQVDYQEALAVRALLAKRYALRSANVHLSALRAVVTEAWRLGLITAEQRARVADVPNVKGVRELRGRAITRDEVKRMFAACEIEDRRAGEGATEPDTTNQRAGEGATIASSMTPTKSRLAERRSARDACLLALLRYGGLRRAEACTARLEDYDRVTGRLKVTGKGNKQRQVQLGASAMARVERWLAVRPSAAEPRHRDGKGQQRADARRAGHRAKNQRGASPRPLDPVLSAAKPRRHRIQEEQRIDGCDPTPDLHQRASASATRHEHVDQRADGRDMIVETLDGGTLLTKLSEPEPLTTSGAYAILKRVAERAGVDPKTIAPHDFRRTFISELFERGADASAIQRLAGHADAATTQRYDRRSDAHVAAAATLLDGIDD